VGCDRNYDNHPPRNSAVAEENAVSGGRFILDISREYVLSGRTGERLVLVCVKARMPRVLLQKGQGLANLPELPSVRRLKVVEVTLSYRRELESERGRSTYSPPSASAYCSNEPINAVWPVLACSRPDLTAVMASGLCHSQYSDIGSGVGW